MRRLVLLLMLAFPAMLAAAETGEMRTGLQYRLRYLPLHVMQREALIEKKVEAAGLRRPKTTLLLTRNPGVKTIKDFTEKERIALLAVQSPAQALTLQSEAEKVLGAGKWSQLDHLTISRGLPVAYASLMDAQRDQQPLFNPPYIKRALQEPGIRAILRERDMLGGDTYSGGVTFTARKFVEDNPKTARAICDALFESMQMIKRYVTAAAETYLALAPQDGTPLAEIIAQLSEDDFGLDVRAVNVMKFADLMHHTGQTKERPSGGKDLFFPYTHDLSGS